MGSTSLMKTMDVHFLLPQFEARLTARRFEASASPGKQDHL
jgi:hypothetical protein